MPTTTIKRSCGYHSKCVKSQVQFLLAPASNLKRIQVKDIVKKVEDYLKTYSSAGMDINWFLVYLDRLEPYLIEILENGSFVPMSPLSTSTNQLTKPQKQWSPEDRTLANKDKRLKSIIISCLPNDIMKSVIKCTTAKAILTDLVLAHKGPSETKDTKIAILRLKFNAFKALEDCDSDVEEDTRSSNEFLADLITEFHDRALLANQKRYY
ncbi:hypothetical protein Tco_1351146 [Tanacetum coccineum]